MSDYDYIQQKRNMVVGAFVIVGLCVFIYMVFLFGELPVVAAKFTSYDIKVRFPNAPGVEQSTPIQYCGFPIGKVTNVSPPMPFKNEQGMFIHQVTVDMSISNDYNAIPANVRVRLFRRGMGSSYIELSNVPMTAAELRTLEPKYLRQGMVLQGEAGTGSELLPEDLTTKFKTLVVKITTLVDNVNEVVGDANNKANFKNSLANLSKATEESITTLQQVREFSTTANQKVAQVSDSVVQTSEELGETLIEVRRMINNINNGQGTVGKLITDDKLYDNLVESSEQLKVSLEKLQKLLDKTSEKGVQFKVF